MMYFAEDYAARDKESQGQRSALAVNSSFQLQNSM
jgi:hypothetical protein